MKLAAVWVSHFSELIEIMEWVMVKISFAYMEQEDSMYEQEINLHYFMSTMTTSLEWPNPLYVQRRYCKTCTLVSVPPCKL